MFNIQEALSESLTGALSKAAKALDLDGDGQKDFEKQLVPMGKKFAAGTQSVIDSINGSALVEGCEKVVADVKTTIKDVKTCGDAINGPLAKKGVDDLKSSVGDAAKYMKGVLANHKPKQTK